MSKPNLLLCFDAFGTLFKPKRSVIEQYGEVARQFGVVIPRCSDQLEESFRRAFKVETKQHPNYGRGTDLGATKWWTAVINNTFTPLLKSGQSLPSALAPALLHRFSSREGYTVEPNLVSAIRSLKRPNSSSKFNDIIIGVITNSDDRVPNVLSSFGLNVSVSRYGMDVNKEDPAKGEFDIDFHCISYDVGFEKPDRRIFEAANSMLAGMLARRYSETVSTDGADLRTWTKIYVGDEYEKDVRGSQEAGWKPIMLGGGDNQILPGLASIEDCQQFSIDQAFAKHNGLQIDTVKQLCHWLAGG